MKHSADQILGILNRCAAVMRNLEDLGQLRFFSPPRVVPPTPTHSLRSRWRRALRGSDPARIQHILGPKWGLEGFGLILRGCISYPCTSEIQTLSVAN